MLLGHEGELVRVSAFGWAEKENGAGEGGGGRGEGGGELSRESSPGKGKLAVPRMWGMAGSPRGGSRHACMRSLNHDTRSSIEFRLRRDKLVILTVAEVVTSRSIATSNHNCLYDGRWRLC